MQNEKKNYTKECPIHFLMRHMHLLYFDFRIYASIQMRLCANQKSRIRQFPSPIFYSRWPQHGSNSISILHWNGRWMLTWSSNLQEKKPYNALSPKKKPISIWPSRSISAMTCNNNNNSEYTKIAFRRKHLGPKNIFFSFCTHWILSMSILANNFIRLGCTPCVIYFQINHGVSVAHDNCTY